MGEQEVLSSTQEEEVLPSGAKQQREDVEFREFPRAFLKLGNLAFRGSGHYGLDNWMGIPQETHLNHALAHIFKHQANVQSETLFNDAEDHLLQAAWRLIAAVEQRERLKELDSSV